MTVGSGGGAGVVSFSVVVVVASVVVVVFIVVVVVVVALLALGKLRDGFGHFDTRPVWSTVERRMTEERKIFADFLVTNKIENTVIMI